MAIPSGSEIYQMEEKGTQPIPFGSIIAPGKREVDKRGL
jgi:hypothetical protein